MSVLTGMRCKCFICRHPSGSKCDHQLLIESKRENADLLRENAELRAKLALYDELLHKPLGEFTRERDEALASLEAIRAEEREAFLQELEKIADAELERANRKQHDWWSARSCAVAEAVERLRAHSDGGEQAR